MPQITPNEVQLSLDGTGELTIGPLAAPGVATRTFAQEITVTFGALYFENQLQPQIDSTELTLSNLTVNAAATVANYTLSDTDHAAANALTYSPSSNPNYVFLTVPSGIVADVPGDTSQAFTFFANVPLGAAVSANPGEFRFRLDPAEGRIVRPVFMPRRTPGAANPAHSVGTGGKAPFMRAATEKPLRPIKKSGK